MIEGKVKKLEIFIYINIILATIMGVYGQDITYYIVDNSLFNTSSSYLYILTILTVLSIALFLATPILIYIFIKKSSVKKRRMMIYLIADILIGIQTSIFSIFVLAMSWG